MMDAMLAALKRHVGAMLDAIPQPRWGLVQSVDPSRPAVKVLLQPEGVLSGWIPVAQSSAGAGLTVLSPIVPGVQAFLVPESGARGADYVATGFSHSDTAQPPKVPNTNGSGGIPNASPVAWNASEYLVVANGSVMRLCANGDIYLHPGSGTVNIDGKLNVNGNVAITGTVTATGNITGFLGGNYVDLFHTHGGVISGGDQTSTPTPGT